MLELSYEYVQVLLYSPYAHYAVGPHVQTASRGYDFACKNIYAAMRLVRMISTMHIRGILIPSHHLTVHALAFAAVTLLLADLGGTPGLAIIDVQTLREACMSTHGLLARLSQSNSTAAGCLASLDVGDHDLRSGLASAD